MRKTLRTVSSCSGEDLRRWIAVVSLGLAAFLTGTAGPVDHDGDCGEEMALSQAVQEPPAELLQTDFGPSFDAQQWEFLGGGWTHEPQGTPPALRLTRKVSDYQPPHRSPTHLALWRQAVEGSFEMIIDVTSTHEDYGHRDVCFFLGWQDPAHFYYVHLAKKTDPHANQIFIVHGADRKAISLETSEGTPWDEAMHSIRVRRDIDTGEIAVWLDNSEKPVMRAVDKTFLNGRIGLGSFDDTADFYRLEVVAVDP
jgi:hypothetical protein